MTIKKFSSLLSFFSVGIFVPSCAPREFNTKQSGTQVKSFKELHEASTKLSEGEYLEQLQALVQNGEQDESIEYFNDTFVESNFEPDMSAKINPSSPNSTIKRMKGQEDIEARMKKIAAKLPGIDWGYEFVAMGPDGKKFQVAAGNANQKMEPASTTKLFTGWATQKLLKNKFSVTFTYPKKATKEFETKFYLSYMLQMSNNNLAEIFRNIIGGKSKMDEFYKTSGIKLSSVFEQHNGSGCNGQEKLNYMTPRDQISLLTHIYQDESEYETFCKHLASPVRPSTLSGTFANFALKKNVCAKTGTFALVKGLSGYVKINDDWTIAFSSLANGYAIAKNKSKIPASQAGAGNLLQEMVKEASTSFQNILKNGGPVENAAAMNLVEDFSNSTSKSLNLDEESPKNNPFVFGGAHCPSSYYKP